MHVPDLAHNSISVAMKDAILTWAKNMVLESRRNDLPTRLSASVAILSNNNVFGDVVEQLKLNRCNILAMTVELMEFVSL